MAPTVFVSSTYVDLKHVREHISTFIENIGYLPRLFEKGGIGFDWQKPIDESCYEAVNESDIFVLIIGGRYGSKATDFVDRAARKYDSVTKKEYITARDKNIPIHIFVDQNVLSEYRTFQKNKNNKSIEYASVDSQLVFELVDDIYRQIHNNYIHSFSKMEDITYILRVQWAAMMSSFIKERSRVMKRNMVRINAIKLFYYRKKAGISIREISKNLGIAKRTYSSLERVINYRTGFQGYHDKYFPMCEFQLVERLEKALNCPGALRSGMHDDFLAHYVEFYNDYSGKGGKTAAKSFPFLPFSTKVVIFDFDGTITIHKNLMTTWEMIWDHLGYEINECAANHTRFRRGEISHDEWCKITSEKFRARAFKQSDFLQLAKDLEIMPGFREVVDDLDSRGIKMYIVSGSIVSMIKESIGDLASKFEAIKANDLLFDSNGLLREIVGTRYDFQGKAEFIRNVVLDRRCSPMDVLFIGNAGNDRWVANAGVRTLCVNPTSTDPDNPRHWTANIRMMKDMREILKFV